MRVFLLVSLCALGCGGESGTIFNDDVPRARAGAGGTPAGLPDNTSGEAGETATEGGAPSSSGGVEPKAGAAVGGKNTSGSGGATQAGSGGAGGREPLGGSATGGAEGGGAGKGGSAAGAGAGGKPSEPEIPEACSNAGACLTTGPIAGQGYCEISDVWPNGACVQCPKNYLDCDGTAPEVYGTTGAGCETFDTNQGKCPAK